MWQEWVWSEAFRCSNTVQHICPSSSFHLFAFNTSPVHALASKVSFGWVNAALCCTLEWNICGLWVIANKSINLESWLLDSFSSLPKPTFIWKQQQIHPEDSASVQASHPAAACLHASEMHLCGSGGITLFHYIAKHFAFPSLTIEIAHMIIFQNQSKAKSDSS